MVKRRELLLAGLASSAGAAAAGPGCGPPLSTERWTVIEPVWARRQVQLETLRRFRVAEDVEPSGE